MGRFRIKISKSWFSDDWMLLRYSTNGIFWRSVEELGYNRTEERCYMRVKTSRVENAKDLLEKFNTLEKINQYEAEQRNQVNEENAEISERKRRHRETRENIYNRYG